MTAATRPVIRILLVDDHEVVRRGLRMLIESRPGLCVVGESVSQVETFELIAREKPDVVLLDLDLGDDNGLKFIPELRRRASATRIIVLTGLRDSTQHQEAVRLGAVGLVFKEQPLDVLVQAIERVHAGQAWLDPGLVANVLNELSRVNNDDRIDPELAKIALLTERERDVIGLVCEGLQNRAIADRLMLSETTVRHHLTSIFAKLGLESRLELLIYAFRNGLATLDR